MIGVRELALSRNVKIASVNCPDLLSFPAVDDDDREGHDEDDGQADGEHEDDEPHQEADRGCGLRVRMG